MSDNSHIDPESETEVTAIAQRSVIELPAGARPGQVFLVMLDAGGMPCVQLSTVEGDVLRSATVATPRLLADFIAYADRSLDMLVSEYEAVSAGRVDNISVGAAREMLHAFVRNIVQGLDGRVLP
jgi:hypothetical protein